MTADLDALPAPTALAGLPLSSHFVMAPMTRKRSPGGVPTAEVLKRFANGEFDLVALGRVLLANPDWVRLAAAGRTGEIHDYRKADEDTYR